LDEGLELAEMSSFLPGDLLGPALPLPDVPSAGPGSSSSVNELCELIPQPHQSAGNGGACLTKLVESPEEEEEAFLRSLGWTDTEVGEQDVALTDEEVAAFMAKAAASVGKLWLPCCMIYPPQ
jgi:hypothetical protein